MLTSSSVVHSPCLSPLSWHSNDIYKVIHVVLRMTTNPSSSPNPNRSFSSTRDTAGGTIDSTSSTCSKSNNNKNNNKNINSSRLDPSIRSPMPVAWLGITTFNSIDTKEEFMEYSCPGAYQLPKNPHVVWAVEWKGWDEMISWAFGWTLYLLEK